MDELRDLVKGKASAEGFVIGATDYVSIDILYAFETWRSDLDNPLKRTLDALSEALDFNDRRVVLIRLVRRTVGLGNHFMEVTVSTISEDMVPSPIGVKRPSAIPIWVGES